MSQQEGVMPGTVYPRQHSPESINRRVQKPFAMKMPENPTRPQDACYEGMLTCFGRIFGAFGSVPFLCPCFPNPFKIVTQGSSIGRGPFDTVFSSPNLYEDSDNKIDYDLTQK